MAPIRGNDRIVIHGLDDLRRELGRLDDATLKGELADTHYRVASMVVDRAKIRLSGFGRMEARAAQTMDASQSAQAARINFGGAAAPFAGGAEFGAERNRTRQRSTGTYEGYRQFKEVVKGGRSIYPTVGDMTNQIVDEYSRDIPRIFARAFPD